LKIKVDFHHTNEFLASVVYPSLISSRENSNKDALSQIAYLLSPRL
jgi:hypothetical protein